MSDFLVATLHREMSLHSRYVKVTIEKEATQIANFVLTCDNVKLIRFYTSDQESLLFQFFNGNFYFANKSELDIESVFINATVNYFEKKVKMIPYDNEGVRIHNFWFSDDINNLKTFERTIRHHGLDIDTSKWNES